MPSMDCACGHRISFGEIPCKDEWLVIADVDFDAITGPVDAEDLYRRMKRFLKCPSCGRMWFFWDGFSSSPQEYLPVPALPAASPKASFSHPDETKREVDAENR